MHEARDKGMREGKREGLREGLTEGILGTIDVLKDYGESDDRIISIISNKYKLNADEAKQYLGQYKKSEGAAEA